MAESAGDDLLINIMNWAYGFNFLWLGELSKALSRFEKVIVFYDPLKHHELSYIYGNDPGIGCLTWSSWTLWLLGFPERALRRSQQAIDLGQMLGDPDSQLFAQTLAVFLHVLLRDPEGSNDLIQSSSSLLAQHSRHLFSADLEFLQGFYRVQKGEPEAGLASISRGLEAFQVIGTRNTVSMQFTLQAEALLRSGQMEQTAQVLQQTEDFIEETGEVFYQAETLRLKWEMLLLQSSHKAEEAEACFRQAILVANRQEAKTLELRAAMSLARLWQSQGRLAEAYQVLDEVYS